jgi:hypothetical protein
VRDPERLGEARVANRRPRTGLQVVGDEAIAAVGEHSDVQRTGGRVEVDVLTVTLVAPNVDVVGFLQASAVAQADVDDLACDRAVERSGTILHDLPRWRSLMASAADPA